MVYHICLSLLHSQYLQKQSLENQHELRITTLLTNVAFQKEQDLHLCRNTKTTTQPEMLSFWTVPSSFIVGNFESSLPLTFFFSSRILLYWGRMVRTTVETNQTEQWYS